LPPNDASAPGAADAPQGFVDTVPNADAVADAQALAEGGPGLLNGTADDGAEGSRDGARRRRRRGGRGRDRDRTGAPGEGAAEVGADGDDAHTALSGGAGTAAVAASAAGLAAAGAAMASIGTSAEAHAEPSAGVRRAEFEQADPGARGDTAGDREDAGDGHDGRADGRRRRGRNRGERPVDFSGDAPMEASMSSADGGDPPAVAAQVSAVQGSTPADSGIAAPAAVASPSVASPTAAGAGTPVRPAVEPFVLPLAALQSLAQQAGLEWVHSDGDKVRSVQDAMAAEPKPVHVPRERKPVVLADDGPLVLVETRKDLSQLRMPFDPPGA
jgi:ribonuclease E